MELGSWLALVLLLVGVRVRCVVFTNLLFIFFVAISFRYHRWVIIQLKVPRTERGSKDCVVPPTVSELEAKLVPCKESGK